VTGPRLHDALWSTWVEPAPLGVSDVLGAIHRACGDDGASPALLAVGVWNVIRRVRDVESRELASLVERLLGIDLADARRLGAQRVACLPPFPRLPIVASRLLYTTPHPDVVCATFDVLICRPLEELPARPEDWLARARLFWSTPGMLGLPGVPAPAPARVTVDPVVEESGLARSVRFSIRDGGGAVVGGRITLAKENGRPGTTRATVERTVERPGFFGAKPRATLAYWVASDVVGVLGG